MNEQSTSGEPRQKEIDRLQSKVNDLEATVMLLGNDLEALTLALHDRQRDFERLEAEVSRIASESQEPAPGPADERPPHY